MYRSSTVYKWKQSKTILVSLDFDVRGQQRINFSLEEVLFWIMDYSSRSDQNFKDKMSY